MCQSTVLDDVPVSEGSLIELGDGRILLVYGSGSDLTALGRISADLGRTWGEPYELRQASGAPVPCAYPVSLVRLKSGAIGMTCGVQGPDYAHPTLFHISQDDGETWSDKGVLDPHERVHIVRCGSLFVASNGDIVAPTMSWMENPVHRVPGTVPADSYESSWSGGEYVMAYSYAMISADEGETWRRSVHTLMALVPGGMHGARNGFFPFSEPAAVELRDGRLLMIGRTNLGRPYRSFSEDGGMHWTQPEPMDLASSYAPLHVKRIPSTGDLVLIWNQASVWEMQHGLRRHRLSTAISTDEGESWGHLRNLESLDNVVYVEPPPVTGAVDCEDRMTQPADRERYCHAPGSLRCTYPTAILVQDRIIVSHDTGCQMSGDPIGRCVLKIHTRPVEWLYEG